MIPRGQSLDGACLSGALGHGASEHLTTQRWNPVSTPRGSRV